MDIEEKASTSTEKKEQSPQHFVVGFRAPEHLLGERRFGLGVDLWAVGVLMSAMLRAKDKPLLQSQKDIPLFMDCNRKRRIAR